MNGKSYLRTALFVIAAVFAMVAVGIGWNVIRTSRSAEGHSLAGVLDTKGRVVVVDLDTGRVLKQWALRSWAFDIAADSSNRTFVTAQSGGADVDVDDKVGIVPAGNLGRVEYVTLRKPNPGGVEVVGDGTVLVDHGLDGKDGMYVCLVDTNKRKVIRDGRVRDLNVPLRVVDGIAWASCASLDGRRSLRMMNPLKLKSEEVLAGTDFPVVETSLRGSLYGWLISEPGKGSIARFNSRTGAVEASTPVDLEAGAGRIVSVRGKLVAADYSGDDLDACGSNLLVFDPETMRLVKAIRVSGGPCDIAVWRDRLVVCNYHDQQLLVIDPVSGRTERRIQLPKMIELPFQVAVVD